MSNKIREHFGQKYSISGKVADVGGRQIYIGYLPFLELLMPHSMDVAGAALFKVGIDFALMHIGDTNDPALIGVYNACRESADLLADEVKKTLREFYPISSTTLDSELLARSFQATFRRTYTDWRESLLTR